MSGGSGKIVGDGAFYFSFGIDIDVMFAFDNFNIFLFI